MANVIVNSGYIKNSTHYLNYLTYSGEKLEAQELVFQDGRTQDISATAAVNVLEYPELSTVRLTCKDGIIREIAPQQYAEKTVEHQKAVTRSVLVGNNGGELRDLDPAKYIVYIAHQPGVEKHENLSHGLFDMDGAVDTVQAANTAAQHDTSIKWSHVISLTREGAERTGFDNRRAWENLIRVHAYDFARIYNISPENLQLQAAYHNKDHHPHCHLFFYSTDPREGFIKGGTEALADASRKLKSICTNTIFHNDLSYLKEQKRTVQTEMKQGLQEIVQRIGIKEYIPSPAIQEAFAQLADHIVDYTGRPYYGYLAPEHKRKVQQLLREVVRSDPNIGQLYEKYVRVQQSFVGQYTDDPEKIQKRLDEMSSRFFSPEKKDSTTLHNILIRSTMQYNQAEMSTGVVRKKETSPADEISSTYQDDGVPPISDHDIPDPNNLVDPDPHKAVDLLQQSAVQGNQYAQYALGKLFLSNEPHLQNIPVAVNWLQASADQGNQFAQYTLGKLYYLGGTIPQNVLLGKQLLQASADLGNPYAGQLLQRSRKQDVHAKIRKLQHMKRKSIKPHKRQRFAAPQIEY